MNSVIQISAKILVAGNGPGFLPECTARTAAGTLLNATNDACRLEKGPDYGLIVHNDHREYKSPSSVSAKVLLCQVEQPHSTIRPTGLCPHRYHVAYKWNWRTRNSSTKSSAMDRFLSSMMSAQIPQTVIDNHCRPAEAFVDERIIR